MKLLAIETSSMVAGAAVLVDGRVAAEEYTDGTLQHARTMMPMTQRVLCAAGVEMRELDALAVDIGPGSFTGIRIGVSAVNAMAMALGKPVVAVDALSALCANVMGLGGEVCAMLDAGNGRTYAARFDNGGEAPKRLGELYFGEVDDWLNSLEASEESLFLGEGAQIYAQQIREVARGKIAPALFCTHRASALGQLAAHSYARGETVREALPIYLARPQAERMLDGGI